MQSKAEKIMEHVDKLVDICTEKSRAAQASCTACASEDDGLCDKHYARTDLRPYLVQEEIKGILAEPDLLPNDAGAEIVAMMRRCVLCHGPGAGCPEFTAGIFNWYSQEDVRAERRRIREAVEERTVHSMKLGPLNGPMRDVRMIPLDDVLAILDAPEAGS